MSIEKQKIQNKNILISYIPPQILKTIKKVSFFLDFKRLK